MCTLTGLFTEIANAIREKKGTSEPITAENFPDEIESIQAGGEENTIIDGSLTPSSGSSGGDYMLNRLIKKLPNTLDTSNIKSFKYFFMNCTGVDTVPLLDCGKAENIQYMFHMNSTNYTLDNLKNLGGLKDLGKAYTRTTEHYSQYTLNLFNADLLTYDSLMNIINNLYDLNLSYNVSGGGTLYRQQVRIGSTNLAKLSAAEILIATNKGWDITS